MNMNRSSVAAISVGTLTTLFLGVTMSLLCPVAGLVAGAYFTATAVAAAGMGTAATWALGAAGAVGGMALGKIAKPLAVWTAMGIGFVTGALTKAAGATVGFLSRTFKKIKSKKIKKPSSVSPKKRPAVFGKIKNAFKSLKPSFKASAQKPAPSKQAPEAKNEPSKPSL